MPKIKILYLCAIICSAAAARASVTVTANGVANLVLSSSGTVLTAGDLIRIGYFSSTANLGTSNSFSSLNSIFTPIGEGSADGDTLTETGVSGDTLEINNITGPGTGTFAGSFNTVSSSYLPTGTQLYMWVFNATSTASSTQWGIFDAPSWTFPPDPSFTTVTLSAPSVSVLRGSTVVMNGTTDYELANIPASVPEPSNLAAFGALAVFGSAFLLRRRSRT